ncbi:MAG TPA: biotin--[acetyl-CoA-carboxylase] ligase [Sphingomonadaceae bacterium]|nr:biotin--[acetyl-CoA-carboxylase] ligase [Sphingomonadaceae bacterium]
MIELVPETGSTNSDLLDRLRSGEAIAPGHWLVADHQTGGRGRLGRQWEGGAGNFMGSTVVRLNGRGATAPGLALAAGLAVYETVLPRLNTPGELKLKWPNDLLLTGAKLAGILMEREADAVVIGVGVNLAHAPRVPGRATVSLSEFGPPPDRDQFAHDLALQFEREVADWRRYGIDSIIPRWLAAAHANGAAISVTEGDGSRIEGTFAGLEGDGALRLRLADGTMRVIHAGDVMQGAG